MLKRGATDVRTKIVIKGVTPGVTQEVPDEFGKQFEFDL